MTSKLENLALRREALLLKIQAQRHVLTLQGRQFKQSMETADIAIHVAGKVSTAIRQRPVLGFALAATIVAIKPQRVITLVRSALTGWQIWQNFAPILRRLQQQEQEKN